jgi:hypothetical protein
MASASMGWLTRAGYARRVRASRWASRVGVLLILVGVLLAREVGPSLLIAGVGFLWLGRLLRAFSRCQVCGLRLHTSAAALSLPQSRRLAWLAALDSCPVCGDDGRATTDSRARWRDSGSIAEPAYWSIRRVLIAILMTLICVGGGIMVAHYTNARTFSR